MCALRNMSAGLVDIFKGRVWRTLKVGVGTDHMYGASHLLPRGRGSGGGGWRCKIAELMFVLLSLLRLEKNM